MSEAEKKISRQFSSDLDEIASDLIKLFGLKHNAEVKNLSEPLLRWVDFRLRYIDPKPRNIFLSNKFPKQLPKEAEKAFRHIIKLIQKGEDVNPYQGAGLILHHDTSGKKRQQRTDLLWADWGIIHLHLTDKPIPSGSRFSERSDWVLLGIVAEDAFGIIDVRRHDEKDLFSNLELVKTLCETWPEIMERFEIKGILPPQENLTSEQHANLRKSGVSSFFTVGKKVYMGPGMGVTSASTATRGTMTMDHVIRCASELAKLIRTPDSEFQKDIKAAAVDEPDFKLCLMKNGLAVYEPHLNKAWVLPKRDPKAETNYLSQLSDLVAPEWALKRVV